MVANIFPLFGLKIDVSVTFPYYPGRAQLPRLGNRDWGEGKTSYFPGGLRDEGPELVTWEWRSQGLGELRSPVPAWEAGVLPCVPLAREATF